MKDIQHIQCRICGYWILITDKSCPNCGTRHPVRKKNPLYMVKLPLISLTGHAGFYALVEVFTTFTAFSPLFALSAGTMFVVSLLFGFLIDRRRMTTERKTRKYLVKDEENIHVRINDIKERIRKINQIKDHTQDGIDPEKKKSMLRILGETETFFQNYLLKFTGELWKLELIRWKNAIEPIEYDWKKSNYEELTKRAEELVKLKDAGLQIRKNWDDHLFAQSRNGKMIIEKIDELLVGCTKFYEAILARQAKLVINDVSPITEKASEIHSQRNPAVYMELFSSKRDIMTFFSAFEDLEKEFDRLEAEEELSVE
jgi:hypothetical protein